MAGGVTSAAGVGDADAEDVEDSVVVSRATDGAGSNPLLEASVATGIAAGENSSKGEPADSFVGWSTDAGGISNSLLESS